MDVKFDVAAADSLILQMRKHCDGICNETRKLLEILNTSLEWKDNQNTAFRMNVNEIAKDLNEILRMEGEYLRTFDQRVKELRG